MKYHCVLFEHGNDVKNLETIKRYALPLMEELDMEGVRIEDLAKGISVTDGAKFLEPADGKLVIKLGLGEAGEGEIIHSNVRYSQLEGLDLAKKLEGICSRWGKQYEQWFAAGGVSYDATLPQQRLVLVIEPYTGNSRGADNLETRLPQLGKELGKALGKWMKEQSPNVGFRPSRPFEKTDKPWIPPSEVAVAKPKLEASEPKRPQKNRSAQ